ncbi:regulatory protein, gntR family [Cupriavidus sp. YR651]|uniref:GntR family transcriptional regulator n=1 Tax=Cupriavidus sp. YR651 TaxID=1855315 RepID=UPI0008844C83|nr:GntR family transcriptional regulator [Cupriavidus sp. YR651]SDD82822.1 regulatory protein, gntR family [Cupriavidus sp. YR651]
MPDNIMRQPGAATAGMSRYGQIAAQLQEKIVTDEWSPGTAIPAESTLAGEFGIALGTIRQAIAVLASHFGLDTGARGLFISRRRWVEDNPRLLESIWLPLPRCAALQDTPVDEWGELLYPLLRQRCGITIHRAMDDVTFRLLDAEEAGLLALPPSHPCAMVTRQAFDIQGQCVEYRLTRGDAYAFRYSAEIR